MAKDPGFIFYPGDYLRDTQCLSEKVQVAYDRIMCEHMRNICISQAQLDFFTKRLNADEKSEILLILKKVDCGYQIEWVAESICKRREYSESRRQNRSKKDNNISLSYVKHMDNENEIDNVIDIKSESKKFKKPTLDEVENYFLERLNTNQPYKEIAGHFYDHYESNGWKVSRNPMKDWKAAINNWIRNDKKYGNTTRSKERPVPMASRVSPEAQEGTGTHNTGNKLLDEFLNTQRQVIEAHRNKANRNDVPRLRADGDRG